MADKTIDQLTGLPGAQVDRADDKLLIWDDSAVGAERSKSILLPQLEIALTGKQAASPQLDGITAAAVTATTGQALRRTSNGWEAYTPAGGIGLSDLSATPPLAYSNSTGQFSLPAATTSAAGHLSAADKTKLDGIAAGATANSTDAQLRDRATHTGTQAHTTITGLGTAATQNSTAFATAAQGALAASALQPAAIGVSVQGFSNNLSSLAGATQAAFGLSLLGLADAAGLRSAAALGTAATANSSDLLNRANHTGTQPSSTITGLGGLATLNNVNTAQITDDAVTLAKLANIATGTLLGRSSAGTGDPEVLSAVQGRTVLGLGTAAQQNSTAFATDAQGLLADTAIQPGAAAITSNVAITGGAISGTALTLPTAAGTAAGQIWRATDLIRYRNAANTTDLTLLNSAGNLANLADANQAIQNLSVRLAEINSLFAAAPALASPRKNAAGTAIEYAQPRSELVVSFLGSATVTNAVAETNATSILIPAGTLQNGCRLQFDSLSTHTSNADNKVIRVRVGPSGTALTAFDAGAATVTTNQSFQFIKSWWLSGNQIWATRSPGPGTSSAGIFNGPIDYAVDNFVYLNFVPINIANTMTFVAASVIIWRPN